MGIQVRCHTSEHVEARSRHAVHRTDFSPLIIVGSPDIVDFLLSRCTLSALLAQNESGNTALHWAAFNGHMTVVQALVDRIESLIQPLTSSNGSRAADKETRKEAELTVEELDAQAEREAQRRSVWDVVNKAGRGPMSEAQMNNKENVVDFLLQRMVTAPAGKADEDVGEADSTKPAEAVVRAEQNGTQEAVKLAERTKQLDLHGTDKS